jgi:putative oxidoreductase
MSFKNRILRLMNSKAPSSIILVRVAVGVIFISEGIQKFIYPDKLGVGRFIKIGIPAPDILAPFVATNEILFGLLILLGLLTRLASIPLIAVMLVAITTTKIPMLFSDGFWFMMHESRTDFSMLISLIFLLDVGAGRLSFDFILQNKVAKNL